MKNPIDARPPKRVAAVAGHPAKRSRRVEPLMLSASRVTVKDIAVAAGVSVATVSMALRSSPEIGEERIRQIRELASQMNYHPRAAAQLLRNKSTGQIGIIVGAANAVETFSTGFTGPLVGSLVDFYMVRGTRYIIEFHSHVQDEAGARPALPYQISSGLVDGSIVVGDVGAHLARMLEQDYPKYPRVTIDETSRHCVLNNSRSGISEVARKLVALGHRRLAYAGGPRRYLTHREGYMGLNDAMTALGIAIPASRILEIDKPADESRQLASEAVTWARQVLRQPNRPTAVICHDSRIARAVILVATELGLQVPADLSVTSWGWSVNAIEQYPPMSTVEFDFRAMTAAAVDMLDRLIRGETISQPRVTIPPRYVEGATVSKPPVDRPGDEN